MISRIGVGADPGGSGGLHGFEVGITGEATGVGHQVAEGDLVNVGTFGPVGGQVVDDLGIVRDVLLVQELGHGHGGDEFADAGHVHQPLVQLGRFVPAEAPCRRQPQERRISAVALDP